jgi:hypothetical protein
MTSILGPILSHPSLTTRRCKSGSRRARRMLKPLGALHVTARSCRLAIDEADVYFFECLFRLGGDGVENLVIVGRELRSAFSR